MGKSVEVTREDFAADPHRTGANPSMFPSHRRLLRRPAPLQQLASFPAPEARTILIPLRHGRMAAIEKAIRDSDLGVNPTNDGKVIRCVFPSSPRSAARSTSRWPRPRPRTAGSRSATSAATPSRTLEKLEKDGEVGKDDVTGAEKRLDG